jgi:hypothetical protein
MLICCTYRVLPINYCRVKPALEKKYYCAAFLKQMPNFDSLLTVIFVLFALFTPVFVPYIRFITANNTKNLYFSINTSGFRAK